ncbi:hypothetical protein PHAVU_005G079733 [Phaseolus vulgaris]
MKLSARASMSNPCFFFFFLIASFCFSSFASGATLPQDEVKALEDIAKRLGKKDWDFSDPCRNLTSESEVGCNCDYNNGTVCHVTNIILKAQNLQGTLPPDLYKLPYLQKIDLSRYYLNGTIPKEWGSTKLVTISLHGNRLTSSIPIEITNISTLLELNLEANQFSGNLSLLGNLTQIQRLLLSSNNFTGELPVTLAKLSELKDFLIRDNQFSGKIPDFIQNWISLTTLWIEGNGFSGPIPSGISNLENLIDLRISDLRGSVPSTFPLLEKMTKLQILDLSFNKLTGQIPVTYAALSKVTNIYLTGNLLNGSVPSWIENAKSIDISYNNLNITSRGSETCSNGNRNLFGNSITNGSGEDACLGDHTCSTMSYNLHINCGGQEVIINGIRYEDDSDTGGGARFIWKGKRNWAVITTVVLHFAEIVFIDGETYSSLGRRVFDIYIQRELVKEDFNIAEEAGGIGKAITKNFTVVVSSNTLEIRLSWTGKGTTSIPSRSVYGPLISAITVKSDNPPPSDNRSVGAVVGIVVAVTVVIILVFSILWWKGCLRKKSSLERELKGLELRTSIFTLRQIKVATNNFDEVNKIGEGGFGPVYKGCLSDGTLIAVKLLSSNSRQGNREFLNEIGMISALQHPYLVKLYGCCVEGDQLLLIYEYMENNSLARALFGPEEFQIKLDWPTRYKICVGIARGLAYLHEESRLKVVHRDIKATNVLLDKDLNPKISDFGLAKLDEEENTHISTRIAGTYGYMAPEYAMHGYLSDKADVYNFGIVVLEIVNGKNNIIHRQKEESFSILDWVI